MRREPPHERPWLAIGIRTPQSSGHTRRAIVTEPRHVGRDAGSMTPPVTRRLLSIGHSYVVAQNRRLAHEMALEGQGMWDVTAAAPQHLRGDLRTIELEPIEGEACRVVPLGMKLGSWAHARRYDGRLRTLLAQRWDVVHVWEEPYVAAGAQIASGAPRSAAVVPATFQSLVKRYPPPLGYFERRVMRRAAGWIAFGQTVHEALRERELYARRPVRVIPPGVDLTCFRPDRDARTSVRARLGWPDPLPVVGFLGRFVPEKGLALLMEVLADLKSPWRALFVGGGPMVADLEAFARRFPNRVRVLTGVSHDEVPAYLNAMDLLCAPSQTTARWREQFGRMLIEGMACGVPVVASRSGEIPHVVGDAGVLLDERDASAWRAAIDRVLASPEVGAGLTTRGLERVRCRYAWPVVARAHLSFFNELLDSR